MSGRSECEHDLEQQLQSACAALEQRVRAGETWRAEDCLASCPALAADDDATLELIYFEYVLREELGQASAPEEWYRRFPAQQTALEKIFRIHHEALAVGPRASFATWTPLETMAEPTATAGRRLQKYVLLEELGRGSMGVVYKARETALKRTVALKMLLAGAHAGAEQLERFHREARAIARLHHPHIVQIHEIGEDEGRPFLCMEFVDGSSLDRVLARWQEQGQLGLTPQFAARLLETLAGAVHYAHQQGIVHRDLKPANILMGSGEWRVTRGAHGLFQGMADDPVLATRHAPLGTPKIADFGLAKFLDGAAAETAAGQLVGTPSYMAPEQASGGEVGPATDVYALGVLLYQLLTGRPPFQAPTVQQTLELVRSAEPAVPRQLQPYLPRDLETICLKCLAKRPVDRYGSAAALGDDLRHFLAGEPIRARRAGLGERTVKWVRRRPVVAGLAAALLLALVGGSAGIVWQWQRAERNAASFQHERDTAIEQRQRAQRHLQRARDSLDQLAKLGYDLRGQPRLGATGKSVLENVLAFYQEVLQEESADPAVRLETARVCSQVGSVRHTLGQWNEAEAAYRQANQLLAGLAEEDPGNTLYRRRLANSYRSLGNVLRDLSKPSDARAAFGRAAQLLEELAAALPAESWPRAALANTYYNAASVLPRREQAEEIERLYGRARELIEAALALAPTDLGYQRERALVLESIGLFRWSQGKTREAEQALRAAVAIQQEQYQRGQLDRSAERYVARAHMHLGMFLAGTGRSEEAQQCYTQAVDFLSKLVDEFPDVYYHRNELVFTLIRQGDLQQQRGCHAEAAMSFRRAVQLDPESGLANNYLAWFLATCPELDRRDAHEAVRLADKAVAVQPRSGACWNTLGVARYRAGDCDGAIAALEQAMQRRGGDEYDWFVLAMAHWKLGRREEARRWLDRAAQSLQNDPSSSEELRRFQAEARTLMDDTSPSKNR